MTKLSLALGVLIIGFILTQIVWPLINRDVPMFWMFKSGSDPRTFKREMDNVEKRKTEFESVIKKKKKKSKTQNKK